MELKVYWWPGLWDEYYYTMEFLAIAESKEEAIEWLKGLIEKHFQDKYKDKVLQKEYKYYPNAIISNLEKIEPNIFPFNKTAHITEFYR